MVVPVLFRFIVLYNQLYMTHSIQIRSYYCTSYLHPVQQSHFICMQNTYYSISCVHYGRFLSSLSNQSSQKWPIIHCYNPSISQFTSTHIVFMYMKTAEHSHGHRRVEKQYKCSKISIFHEKRRIPRGSP